MSLGRAKHYLDACPRVQGWRALGGDTVLPVLSEFSRWTRKIDDDMMGLGR